MDCATNAGGLHARIIRQELREETGRTVVRFAASNVDVNSGSALDVQWGLEWKYLERLVREAVKELSVGVAVDEQRIAQEIAILADRLDVSEEMSRFRSHLAAFRTALSAPPADGVGKRLGFLLQELLREANTTGSKGADSTILQDVLLIKEELERIREQVENLE